MKITSLVAKGVLTFNDLGKVIKGVSPIERSIRLNPGDSLYLQDTSEVLLSAQSGDIRRYVDAGKLSVNDRALTVADSATVTVEHNFGIIPNVTVIVDPTGTPTEAVVGTDVVITHDTSYNTTTVQNTTGGAADFDIRVG